MMYHDPNDPTLTHVLLHSFTTRTGTMSRWASYREGVELYRTTQFDDDPPDGAPAVSLREAA
jgi:hypothetical protein